jgi:hypothetical protein
MKAMLQEYMRRLILEQPVDPLNFLINSIKAKPFILKAKSEIIAITETDASVASEKTEMST